MHLKIHSVDVGYCRAYYTHGDAWYCLQEDSPDKFVLYDCDGPDGEPGFPQSLDGITLDPFFPADAKYKAYCELKSSADAFLDSLNCSVPDAH